MEDVDKIAGEERFLAERKVFGRHEMIELPINQLVVLPQVRSGLNPELPSLKKSIDSNGLLNPIDVARMEESELATYIDFVNQIWGSSVTFDSYEHLQQADGKYYMVIAGHSRAEAIRQLHEESQDEVFDVAAKVHDATSPEHIIELQLSENIHSTPSPERRAMAIVETYLYGLKNGSWGSKAQFIGKSRGISRDVLNEALGFAQLPSEARDFVFSGTLSYGAAVELGKGSDTVMDYTRMKLGLSEDADESIDTAESTEVAMAYRYNIDLIINGIFSRGLNVGASRKFVRGQVSLMNDQLELAKGRQVQPEIALFTAEESRKMYLSDLRKQIVAANRQIKHLSVESITHFINLQKQLVGEDVLADLEFERTARIQKFGGSTLLHEVKVAV